MGNEKKKKKTTLQKAKMKNLDGMKGVEGLKPRDESRRAISTKREKQVEM